MTSSNILDLTGDRLFKKDDWMGKKYPTSDVPEELAEFRKSALEIPTIHREALLPDPTLSVETFVALSLPAAQETLISYGAKSCFVKRKPTEHVSCLKTRNLPSREFVEDAEVLLGQALLDGALSIQDPTYKGEGLPVWTIQYWREMHAARQAQDEWRKSIAWLQKHGTETGMQPDFSQARKHLHQVQAQIPQHRLLPSCCPTRC